MLAIYKPGQGYWTRMLTAVGVGILVLGFVLWLRHDVLERIKTDYTVYLQAGVAVAVILVVGGFMFWLLNKPRIVDFMIATEAEMKKVNWPTRRELLGSTWIVICGTVMMAVLLFVIDLLFAYFFTQVGVLRH